jgi:serine/threonine protein kinase
LRIAIEITRILEQLYQNQIIHKDVKLQNILVHPDTLKIQLIDFSISTRIDSKNQEYFHPQGLEGTLAYMSPEQTGRTHRGIDYRTDLYSLGVTLYQLFTRKLPFQSSEPLELIHAHLALSPLPLVEIRPSLPLMLNNIVLKLMAKNPEERYQTPLGLLHDLEFCLEQWETLGDIPLFPLATMDLNDHFIIPDKFYGRESELARLSLIFPDLESRIIVITGQSGMGKSSLVQEFYQKIFPTPGYFISGKFDQFINNTPFGGWVQGIKQLIQQFLTETPAKVEDWKTKLIEALGEKTQVLLDVITDLKSLLIHPLFSDELQVI